MIRYVHTQCITRCFIVKLNVISGKHKPFAILDYDEK